MLSHVFSSRKPLPSRLQRHSFQESPGQEAGRPAGFGASGKPEAPSLDQEMKPPCGRKGSLVFDVQTPPAWILPSRHVAPNPAGVLLTSRLFSGFQKLLSTTLFFTRGFRHLRCPCALDLLGQRALEKTEPGLLDLRLLGAVWLLAKGAFTHCDCCFSLSKEADISCQPGHKVETIRPQDR